MNILIIFPQIFYRDVIRSLTKDYNVHIIIEKYFINRIDNSEFYKYGCKIHEIETGPDVNELPSFQTYVEKIIIENNINYILPLTNEVMNVVISNINTKLKLPGVTSDYINFFDKKFYYSLMNKLNVPVPKLYLKNKDTIEFPVIVKPAKGSAGIGSKILYDKDQLDEWFSIGHDKIHQFQEKEGDQYRYWEYFSFGGDYLIQQYIESDLITISGRIFNNKFYFDLVCDIIVTDPPYCSELEFSTPSKHNETMINKIFEDCKKFLLEIGVDNTPFMFDVLIDKNKKHFFIDFGLRMTTTPQPILHEINKDFCKNWISQLFYGKAFILENNNKHIIHKKLNLKKGKILKCELNSTSTFSNYKLPVANSQIYNPRNDLLLDEGGFVTVTGQTIQEAVNNLNQFLTSLVVNYE